MDKAKFLGTAPGKLVQIEAPEPDWAFIPNPIPEPWELPAHLVPLLVQARTDRRQLELPVDDN